MEKLGNVIREVRRNKDISQKELARMLDLDWTLISKIENNRIAYDRNIVTRIAYALDIPAIVFETLFDLLDTPSVSKHEQEHISLLNECVSIFRDVRKGRTIRPNDEQIYELECKIASFLTMVDCKP